MKKEKEKRGMDKSLVLLLGILFSLLLMGSAGACTGVGCGECVPQTYDSNYLCLNTGIDSSTGLSTYITQMSGDSHFYTPLTNTVCGNGAYYVDSKTGFLKIKTTSLPFAGNYTFQFYYGLGSPNDINTENFTLKCSGKTYNFPDNDNSQTENTFRFGQVTCDFNSGYNYVEIQSTDMGSVFFKKFKITGSLTCPEPPVCPLNEEDYDELIIVNEKIVSKVSPGFNINTSVIPVSLSPGIYTITLVASDGYSGRESVSQPNEQYKLALLKTGNQVALTPSTSDLQDNVAFAQVVEIVTNNLALPNGADSIKGVHAKFGEVPTSTPNSVNVTCIGIKKNPEIPKYCGDGVINQANETCDDGNLENGDGCSAQCDIETFPVCGNGIIEEGEECDDGNLDDNDGCSSTCETEEQEICEYNVSIRYSYVNSFGTGIAIGFQNFTWISGNPANLEKGIYKMRYYIDNNIPATINDADILVKLDDETILSYSYLIWSYHSKTISFDTSELECGLHTLSVQLDSEANEICTSDNTEDNYAEREFYIACEEFPVCGNGIIEEGEECDDGNLDDNDGCSSTCETEEQEICEYNVSIRYSYVNSFGTGIAINNSEDYQWVSETPALLKQGFHKIRYYVDNAEEEKNNATITVKLDNQIITKYFQNISTSHYKTVSIDLSNAECDSLHKISVKVESENNGICTPDNAVDNYAERAILIECEEEEHFCSDGHLDAGEECDDGNLVNNDGCSSICKDEICGDNIKQTIEECDLGNNNGKPCSPAYGGICTYCSNTCEEITLTDGYCGDGILQSQYEECDDHNLINGDGCSSTCDKEALPVCGDGVINQANETCDDHNLINNDGCSSICKTELCGDGIKQTNEQCDDGNTNNLDLCRNNCKLPVCGDGIKDNHEYCDDGNTMSGDGCSKTCRLECLEGICTPNITIEDFPPQVWQCDHRIVYDDGTEPGRISLDGTPLVERINNYAFEGEQITWKVLVMDKNGVEKIKDVYVIVDGNIEANCQRLVWSPGKYNLKSCNARILEEEIDEFNPRTMAYYYCTLSVETPEVMYGEYFVTVEAEDFDGVLGTMDENEYWFLNPTVSLGIEGGLVFEDLRPGTMEYSEAVVLTNNAEDGSGVLLDVFISGTNFYDKSSSGAMCPTTNQLRLERVNYYASGGSSSTQDDSRADDEGYVPIKYGIGFNNPNPFYNHNEIIQSSTKINGVYYAGNILTPGADMSLIFRVDVPEPCNGNFDSGGVYFWGEAI